MYVILSKESYIDYKCKQNKEEAIRTWHGDSIDDLLQEFPIKKSFDLICKKKKPDAFEHPVFYTLRIDLQLA